MQLPKYLGAALCVPFISIGLEPKPTMGSCRNCPERIALTINQVISVNKPSNLLYACQTAIKKDIMVFKTIIHSNIIIS
jgi:hypothetical protein